MEEVGDGFNAMMEDVRENKSGGPRPITFDAFSWSKAWTPHDLTGLAVGMIYQKSPRESSRRWITIRNVSPDAPQKMMAYCWLRNAVKGFRLDRILALYDTDGVTMEPADFFGSFGVRIDGPAPPQPMATGRIAMTIPPELLARIEAITDDRDGFIVQAIEVELLRRS
jgi:hypothetical protein